MQAIEFETYLKDGIIKIPEKYSNFNEKKIKVIIMSEDDDLTQKEKVENFLKSIEKYKFKLPDDYKFNRDEIYER